MMRVPFIVLAVILCVVVSGCGPSKPAGVVLPADATLVNEDATTWDYIWTGTVLRDLDSVQQELDAARQAEFEVVSDWQDGDDGRHLSLEGTGSLSHIASYDIRLKDFTADGVVKTYVSIVVTKPR